MKEWYYQIKGKLATPEQGMFFGGLSNWSFPPIFVGKVEADDRKAAIETVHTLFGKRFPTRVLQNDLDSNEFLLSITEIIDERTKSLFYEVSCQHCGIRFRVIDHYNNHNQRYKGNQYCSDECKQDAYEVARFVDASTNELSGIHPAIIYCITNNETGLSYIGKTTQAFTLRWYQHFFQSGDNKFHKAIKSSNLHDWSFRVIEVITFPENCKSKSDCEKHIFEREKYWIKRLDSVKNGYNSVC